MITKLAQRIYATYERRYQNCSTTAAKIKVTLQFLHQCDRLAVTYPRAVFTARARLQKLVPYTGEYYISEVNNHE